MSTSNTHHTKRSSRSDTRVNIPVEQTLTDNTPSHQITDDIPRGNLHDEKMGHYGHFLSYLYIEKPHVLLQLLSMLQTFVMGFVLYSTLLSHGHLHLTRKGTSQRTLRFPHRMLLHSSTLVYSELRITLASRN